MPKGMNPKSLKNLKPCKKGETHNPNGQPRKGIALCNHELQKKGYLPATKADIEANYMSLINVPRKELIKMGEDEDKPMLIRIIIKNMLGGKGFDVIEKMLDRGIGKAIQREEITGKNGGSLDIALTLAEGLKNSMKSQIEDKK